MKELYPDAVEDKTTNAPPPKGKRVQITCFVDVDHGGDQVTRRSRTGILIYVNKAPIIWYNERQNTVKTSTYGSEMVAMRIALIISTSRRIGNISEPYVLVSTVFCRLLYHMIGALLM